MARPFAFLVILIPLSNTSNVLPPIVEHASGTCQSYGTGTCTSSGILPNLDKVWISDNPGSSQEYSLNNMKTEQDQRFNALVGSNDCKTNTKQASCALAFLPCKVRPSDSVAYPRLPCKTLCDPVWSTCTAMHAGVSLPTIEPRLVDCDSPDDPRTSSTEAKYSYNGVEGETYDTFGIRHGFHAGMDFPVSVKGQPHFPCGLYTVKAPDGSTFQMRCWDPDAEPDPYANFFSTQGGSGECAAGGTRTELATCARGLDVVPNCDGATEPVCANPTFKPVCATDGEYLCGIPCPSSSIFDDKDFQMLWHVYIWPKVLSVPLNVFILTKALKSQEVRKSIREGGIHRYVTACALIGTIFAFLDTAVVALTPGYVGCTDTKTLLAEQDKFCFTEGSSCSVTKISIHLQQMMFNIVVVALVGAVYKAKHQRFGNDNGSALPPRTAQIALNCYMGLPLLLLILTFALSYDGYADIFHDGFLGSEVLNTISCNPRFETVGMEIAIVHAPLMLSACLSIALSIYLVYLKRQRAAAVAPELAKSNGLSAESTAVLVQPAPGIADGDREGENNEKTIIDERQQNARGEGTKEGEVVENSIDDGTGTKDGASNDKSGADGQAPAAGGVVRLMMIFAGISAVFIVVYSVCILALVATMKDFTTELMNYNTCLLTASGGFSGGTNCVHPSEGENSPSLAQLVLAYLCTSSLPLLFGVLFSGLKSS